VDDDIVATDAYANKRDRDLELGVGIDDKASP
jgi:hypothetical protein